MFNGCINWNGRERDARAIERNYENEIILFNKNDVESQNAA
ncbi:hypothetical protein FEM08_26490 [Flavobacterium gilvum]|nr:hypothetical protein FEM08_26490 [Flavobacterium gilvum]